jgi:DNA replication protein DnaC
MSRNSSVSRGQRACWRLKTASDSAEVSSAARVMHASENLSYSWTSIATGPSSRIRTLLAELFTFDFLEQTANIIIVGPNGLGKTMIAKNLLRLAVSRGCTARFTVASDMLHDLAAQDSSTHLARRLRRYSTPTLLCVDEVGYLSYDARCADLLFELIARRYQLHSVRSNT